MPSTLSVLLLCSSSYMTTSTGQVLCSSLDGPFCPPINGKEKPNTRSYSNPITMEENDTVLEVLLS